MEENRIRKVRVREESGGHWTYKERKGWFGIKYKVSDRYVRSYKEYEGWLHKIETKKTGGVTEDGPYMRTSVIAIVEDVQGYVHETAIKNIQYIDKITDGRE